MTTNKLPRWINEKVSSRSKVKESAYWMRLEGAIALDENTRNRRALDIGCNIGSLPLMLLEKYQSVVGLDAEFVCLTMALDDIPLKGDKPRKRHDFAKVQAYGEHLPFQDEVFDTIYCIGTIEVVADRNQVFSEMWRCLSPGGILILGMPIKAGLGGLFRQIAGLLIMGRRLIRNNAVRKFNLPDHTFNWRDVVKDLKRHDFRVEKKSFIPFNLLKSANPYVIIRAAKQ